VAYIKNKLLFHSVIVQNILAASKTKKRERKAKKNSSKRCLLDSTAEN
jgi:hypothetical protein